MEHIPWASAAGNMEMRVQRVISFEISDWSIMYIVFFILTFFLFCFKNNDKLGSETDITYIDTSKNIQKYYFFNLQ